MDVSAVLIPQFTLTHVVLEESVYQKMLLDLLKHQKRQDLSQSYSRVSSLQTNNLGKNRKSPRFYLLRRDSGYILCYTQFTYENYLLEREWNTFCYQKGRLYKAY